MRATVNIAFQEKIADWRIIESFPRLRIGVGAAIASKTNIDELTKETAIPILKKIVWKSTLLSLITKPIFLISVGIGVSIIGLGSTFLIASFPPALPLLFISIPVASIGGGIIGGGLEGAFKGTLSTISNAYAAQKKQARNHLETLKNLPEDTNVTFSIKQLIE